MLDASRIAHGTLKQIIYDNMTYTLEFGYIRPAATHKPVNCNGTGLVTGGFRIRGLCRFNDSTDEGFELGIFRI